MEGSFLKVERCCCLKQGKWILGIQKYQVDHIPMWGHGCFFRGNGKKGGPSTCVKCILDVIVKDIQILVLDPSFLLNHGLTAAVVVLAYSQLGSHFKPVREAVEMVSGNAWSCFHREHMATSFTPLMQTSEEFNIPSPHMPKTSKNTHFLQPLRFLYTSITNSSFWHSFCSHSFSYKKHILTAQNNYRVHAYEQRTWELCWEWVLSDLLSAEGLQ